MLFVVTSRLTRPPCR